MRTTLPFAYYRFKPHEDVFNNFLQTDPSLQDILSHPQTEQQLRRGNPQLFKQIDRPQLKELVKHITQQPEVDLDSSSACKFPYIASEFFSSQSSLLLGSLIEDEELMTILFDFLNIGEAGNPTLMGYFAKTVIALCRYDMDALLKFIYEKGYHRALVRNLVSESVFEVLVMVMTSKGFLEEKFQIVDGLLEIMSNPNKVYAIMASKALVFLLKERLSIWNYNEILQHVLQDFNLKWIFGYLEDRDQIKIVAGPVEAIVDSLHENDPSIEKLASVFAEVLPNLAETLKESSEILGEHRLSIIRIIHKFLTLGNLEIDELILQSQILQTITDLFQQFEWNSILNNLYTDLAFCVLNSTDRLKQHLLLDCKLVDLLAQLGLNPFVFLKNKQFRRGCMGSVFLISNKLLILSDSDLLIQQAIDSNPLWGSLSLLINQQNQLQAKKLGGDPFKHSESSDESLFQIETPTFLMEPMQILFEDEFSQVNFWKVPNDFLDLDTDFN